MSVLTKVFVVFHVVVSLLLAAGLIVFVNRTEVFRESLSAKSKEAETATAQLANKKSDAEAARADAEKYRKLFDDSQKSLADAKTGPQKEIGDLREQLAKAGTDSRIAAITAGNTADALKNALQQRKAVDDVLASTRTEYDAILKKTSELNIALSDTQQKLDVSIRTEKDITERYAEAQAEIDRQGKLLTKAGIKDQEVSPGAGAPRINAVVKSVASVNGIPHATISVGSDEQVKVGMRFSVIDRDGVNFLGFLTIDGVDAKEATGKLEGPQLPKIVTGSEARTQL